MADVVWIVHQGCRYEGGGTEVVCSSYENAVRYARHRARRDRRNHVDRYSYIDESGKRIKVRKRWNWVYKRLKDTPWRWESGSDFIGIYEMRIY